MASTRAERHPSRSRWAALAAALVGVGMVVAAIGVVNAHGSKSTPPVAAVTATPTPVPTPKATGKPATKAATKQVVRPKARATHQKPPAKKVGQATAVKKRSAAGASGSTAVTAKKLPVGIAEPGRKVVRPVDVKQASVADSIRVALVGFKSVKSQASGLGEISAPAVRLTIRLTNTGAKAVPLSSVVVDAYYGAAGTPGIQIEGDPASRPFAGALKPGAAATGVFVFNMPVSKRGDATITVSPSPTLPIAVFAGSVA